MWEKYLRQNKQVVLFVFNNSEIFTDNVSTMQLPNLCTDFIVVPSYLPARPPTRLLILVVGFRRVCHVHVQFLFSTSFLMMCRPALHASSVSVIVSCHLMLEIYLKHLFMNVYSVLVVALVSQSHRATHISHWCWIFWCCFWLRRIVYSTLPLRWWMHVWPFQY